jgi:hypothetical protein
MPKLCRVTQKLTFRLQWNSLYKTNKNKDKLEPLPGRFIWNEEAITRYKNNMQSVEIKQKLQNCINHDYKDCSTAVEMLTSVLHDTALASRMLSNSIHYQGIYLGENNTF